MNLSPVWVETLTRAGHTALHWSTVGRADATDHEILCWAKKKDYIVFTHDLDFGVILAATKLLSPSVIQVRTHSPLPEHIGDILIDCLKTFDSELYKGALITIDEKRLRVRVLPI